LPDEVRDFIEELEQKHAARDANPGKKLPYQAFDNALAGTRLPELAVRIKDYAFKDEREERLIIFRSDQYPSLIHRGFHTKVSMVVPHLRFKLDERAKWPGANPDGVLVNPICAILIGPSAHQELTKRAIEMLVQDTWPTAQIQVALSRVPFRSW
jgi:hypothetical protein